MSRSKPEIRRHSPTFPMVVDKQSQASRPSRTPQRASNGRMSKQAQMAIVCGAAGGVLVALLLVLGLVQSRSGPDSSDSQAADSSGVSGAHAAARSSNKTGSRSSARRPSWRTGTPLPSGPRTLADLLTAPQEPLGEPGSGNVLLAAARQAMAGRNLDAARHHAEAAAEKAQTDEQKAEAQRVLRLLGHLEQFWKAVRAEAGTIQSGQELAVGEKRLIILEASTRGLAFRHEGKFYSMQIDELPVPIAVALAQRRLGTDSPVAHLCVGAFLAVDPKGDRHKAREHWQQAGTTGRLLLPEIEAAASGGREA